MVATAKLKDVAGNSFDSFQVDVRIQGVSLEAIHRDTDRMTRIQKSVDELQAGYHTNSIIDDFRIQHVQRSFMA